jgi:hypothetical protein
MALVVGFVLALLVGCQGPSTSCDPMIYGELPCL